MSKRLAFLEKLVQDGKADSFARYGLAMEYRTLGRKDDAKRTFEALRAADPGYVPMYLMAGQLWSETGDREAARVWVEQGIAAARAKHDAHALSELESLAAELSLERFSWESIDSGENARPDRQGLGARRLDRGPAQYLQMMPSLGFTG